MQLIERATLLITEWLVQNHVKVNVASGHLVRESGGADGNGLNRLGQILMAVREELRQKERTS